MNSPQSGKGLSASSGFRQGAPGASFLLEPNLLTISTSSVFEQMETHMDQTQPAGRCHGNSPQQPRSTTQCRSPGRNHRQRRSASRTRSTQSTVTTVLSATMLVCANATSSPTAVDGGIQDRIRTHRDSEDERVSESQWAPSCADRAPYSQSNTRSPALVEGAASPTRPEAG